MATPFIPAVTVLIAFLSVHLMARTAVAYAFSRGQF